MNKRALPFVALAVVILAGLFIWLRPPAPEPVRQVPASPAPVAAAAAPVPPPEQVYRYQVAGGRRLSGPESILVHAGEVVNLEVTSDRADELHLHGYDLHLQLQPGQPGQLRFTAVHSGRFDFELHHADLELGVLQVLPQ